MKDRSILLIWSCSILLAACIILATMLESNRQLRTPCTLSCGRITKVYHTGSNNYKIAVTLEDGTTHIRLLRQREWVTKNVGDRFCLCPTQSICCP